ncbi:TRAF-like superfamily protein [Perilla frutescens var. hirtella]|nr:TRAF-like superfamily protein [Perilla frutescens var. hirtella]
MDPPTEGIELQPEKLEEEKEGGPLCQCDFCDADIVDKIAQSFIPGLASACIDNTTGGLFKTPATVAVDIRKEMVDYLIQRSENFVAESVVLEGGADVEVSVDPYDVISDFVDDFVHSKRNFFSRVSGWLLSEKREDWIDDLVQEMEMNGFWLLNRRSIVAQTLLKNLDFRNTYHCNMNFKSPEDLEKHKLNCGFRTLSCTNEGCDSSFSAAQMDHHDSTCPFKMLPCEQNCPDIIMRREMDRHCITTCPMKLVKCPFYSVGCQSTVPQRKIEQHRSENLPSHVLYVLQVSHKEASPEDLKERVQELEKIASPGRLVSARDARSLTYVIKDLEAKLGPLKVKTNTKCDDEIDNSVDEKEEKTDAPAKHVEVEGKNEQKTNVPVNQVGFDEAPTEKKSTATANSHSDHGNGEVMNSSTSDREGSSRVKGETVESSSTADRSASSQTNEEEVAASFSTQENSKEEHSTPTIQQEKLKENEPTVKNEMFTESPPKELAGGVSTTAENEKSTESSPGEEEGVEALNRDVGGESAPVEKEKVPSTQQN